MEGKVIKEWESINFVFYLSFVKWPVLVAVVIELASRFLASRFFLLSVDRLDLMMWVVRLAAFVYIGWQVGRAYGEARVVGALAGGLSGLVIGLAAALFRLSQGFRVWKVFNLITETALATLVGCLVVFLIVYLWDFWPKKLKGKDKFFTIV